jgi:predicted amidohydrolase
VAYFIAAASGSILASYQKKNLWHPERGILTPDLHTPHTSFTVPFPKSSGTSTTTSTPTIRVGLLICWDLAFPEAFRELATSYDAQLVIVPAFWHINKINPRVLALNQRSEVAFLDSVAVARAYENTCAVAFCNAFGQSQVAVPILGCLGKMGAEEEGMVSCEVDFEVVRFAEENYKVKKDVRDEGWHYSRSATVLETDGKAV